MQNDWQSYVECDRVTSFLQALGRLQTSTLVIGVSVINLVLVPVASQFTDTSQLVATGGSAVLALLVFLSTRLRSALADYIIATALIGQAMLATAVFSGHGWQIDMHMTFFALLAVISITDRIGALIWACLLTAVHHLGLTLILPALVYPSSDLLENLGRTALHGGVVVIEGVVLALALWRRHLAQQEIESRSRQLEIERQMAEDMQNEVAEAHKAARKVIDDMRLALTKLAGRDLAAGIQDAFPEKYEILRTEFNMTVETIRDAFTEANEVTDQFASESLSLSETVQGLTRMTDLQARALAEMTEATTQLVAVLSDTAKQAKDAAASATEARDSAMQGGEVTTKAITAMREIEDSSRQISSIVDLIDDVSFQTNLLALNAGVEAARAGESGKGFAVVAMEVQQLAQRTAEAAKGIKQLITNSSDQVTSGAELVDAVGRRLEAIQTQISHTSDVTRSISDMNDLQAASLDELHKMMQQTDEQTRKAVVLGDDLANMARRMSESSKTLSQNMRAFTFTEEDLLREVRSVG
jgi:methyl-accepting chemotaxis protein